MNIRIKNLEMELLPERAVFMADSSTLILSDLHLGKTTHFRKSGISMPVEAISRDYMRLNELIERKQPSRIIIIGDLFHSSHNHEWNIFCEFVTGNSSLEFILVKGNHDVLAGKHYKEVCMTVVNGSMDIGDLVLSHEPLNNFPEGKINISGHIHPGYLLQGKGKQRIPLPCYYRIKDQLILPAFGSLTGLYLVDKEKGAEIFVIAGDKVIAI